MDSGSPQHQETPRKRETQKIISYKETPLSTSKLNRTLTQAAHTKGALLW